MRKKCLIRIAFLQAILLLMNLILSASAYADNKTITPEEDVAYSFEDIKNNLCEKYQIREKWLILGYKNLVTGEEHYWQGDLYQTAASMYKVPLNMYIAEKIKTKELDWEKRYPKYDYIYAMESSLIESSNMWSKKLWESVGSYGEFREGIMPYLGMKPEEVTSEFKMNNMFTARQLIHCLSLLYEESERFPLVLDTMAKAEPDRFFRLHQKDYRICQKYGFIELNGILYINTCGIVYTDEPIALVIFTKGVPDAEGSIGEYCTSMCSYTMRNIE